MSPHFCYGSVSDGGLALRYQIRRSCAADWAAIAAVHERAVRFEPHFLDVPDRLRIAPLQHVFRGDLWVADAGRTIVGFVACVRSDIPWLYVDPKYFRMGIGRALLRHALQLCGPVASITILAENVACLALVTAEGFIQTATEMVTLTGFGAIRAIKTHRIALIPVDALPPPALPAASVVL